jgi:hypothetical protein
MWEIATNLSEVLGGLLFLCWALTGYRAGRMVPRPAGARLRRGARWNLALLGVDLVVLLAQLVMVALTWMHGWVFAENRVLLAVPPVLVGAVAVLVWLAPRLWRIGRAGDRSVAADPLLVVPIQAAAVGGLLDFWVVFVARPAPPYLGDAVLLWTVLLAATALLWWRQRRRQRRLGEPQAPRRPGLAVRGLRALAGVAAVAAVLAVWIGYGLRASRLPDRLAMSSMATVDWGGGPAGMPVGMRHDHAMPMHMGTSPPMSGTMSVADLTGPRDQPPDVRYTLTAVPKRIRLSSGATVDAWAFNGQVPGPTLRAHQGDLVEVTLVNKLPDRA